MLVDLASNLLRVVKRIPRITHASGSAPFVVSGETGIATFSNPPWIQNVVTLTDPSVAGPSGSGAATRITGGGGNFNGIYRPGNAGATVTFKAVVKDVNSTWCSLRMDNAGAKNAWFNLATGTTGMQSIGTSSILSLGDGWYELTAVGPNDGSVAGVWLADADGSTQAGAAGRAIDLLSVNIT